MIIKGFDMDGTLIAYEQGYVPDNTINYDLIDQVIDRGDKVAILTNQGGIPLGYRTAGLFVARFSHVKQYIQDVRRAKVVELQVALWHEKATREQIAAAFLELSGVYYPDASMHCMVWAQQAYRKPEPRMLQIAGVGIYYGDSDEDERAAAAAGVQFVRVPRFMGGGQ